MNTFLPKTWTIISNGCPNLLQASMGNIHWIKTHFNNSIIFNMYKDDVSDKTQSMLNYLDSIEDEGLYIIFFDNIYMKRITRFRVVDGRTLINITHRIHDIESDGAILCIHEDDTHLDFSAHITHQIGHTIKMNKGMIPKNVKQSLTGACVDLKGARQLYNYMVNNTPLNTAYYFAEPIVNKYTWDYENIS